VPRGKTTARAVRKERDLRMGRLRAQWEIPWLNKIQSSLTEFAFRITLTPEILTKSFVKPYGVL
jgi:hypothetical protein